MGKFDQIYQAAVTLDETKLANIRGTVAYNHQGISPITQLAAENNHDAVEFLIKHRFFTVNSAARGYAMAGNHEKAKEMLERGAEVGFLLYGYAIAGDHEKVKEYSMHEFQIQDIDTDSGSMKKQKRLNTIVQAYASTHQHDKVEEYLKLGATRFCAMHGYALGGNHEKVREHYIESMEAKAQITMDYISTLNHEKIDTYCRQELGVSRYQIAALYVYNQLFSEAKDILIAELIDNIKKLRENYYVVNALFGNHERISNLQNLMQELMVAPNHSLSLKDLFAKHQLSDLLREADNNDIFKPYLKKLLLDPGLLHLAHGSMEDIPVGYSDNSDIVESLVETNLDMINEDAEYFSPAERTGLRHRYCAAGN